MTRRLVSLAPLLIIALLAGLAPAAMAAPPSGFLDTSVVSVPSPTALAWTPDGRLLVTSQIGQLRVYQNGVLLPNAALDLRAPNLACVNHERGLLGLAVDPSLAANHFIYTVLHLQQISHRRSGAELPGFSADQPQQPGQSGRALHIARQQQHRSGERASADRQHAFYARQP
jgi:glucose/arabinose dehydrogenase